MGSGAWGEPVRIGPVQVGWRLIVVPLAFALLATVLVTALALGDARPELATMAAVGASPGVRRRFAMWAAIVVAAVGSVLGVLAGIAPAWAALRSADLLTDPAQCLWSPVRPGAADDVMNDQGMVYCDVPLAIPLDVPWTWLAAVAVGLPLVAGLIFLMASPHRGCMLAPALNRAGSDRAPGIRRTGAGLDDPCHAHDDVPMGHLDISRVTFALPDGRVLLDEVSFKVAEGKVTALVGANGSGKSTLMRMIAGDEPTQSGAITRVGSLGIMRQFVGHMAAGTLRDLLLAVAPPSLAAAAAELDAAELAMMDADDEATQMRYAHAIAEWAEAGGYDLEVVWDVVSVSALGVPFAQAQYRELATLSGGEQKRIVLEALFRGPDEVLLLDEPDNYLDVPGKQWLEAQAPGDAQDRPAHQPRPRAAGQRR